MKSFFDKNKVLIIAEIAQAHDGSLGSAHAYIDAISSTGADAVKFQTHIASEESTSLEPWRVKFSFEDETRYDYWKRMEFTEEQWIELKKHAEEKGLLFMSSPFSVKAAQMLNKMGMKLWKIASGEVSDPWLMDYVISTDKPVIFSTGMSDMNKIREYAKKLKEGNADFALLQCTTNYPVSSERIGLNLIRDFIAEFSVPVGLSDHSGTMWPSIAATATGAKIIETHVCLSKRDFGPDVLASLDIDEFAKMVSGIRYTETMLSNPVDKDILAKELEENGRIFSKSVCAAAKIQAGDIISKDMLALKKPCNGIPANEYQNIIGKKAKKTFDIDEFITYGEVE